MAARDLTLRARGPLTAADLMAGGAPIGNLPQPQVSATVLQLLRAGVQDFDTAPRPLSTGTASGCLVGRWLKPH